MNYDDIPNDSENPFPGKLFNVKDGPDVREGVNIDYSGDDVTAANFLKIIKGDKEAMAGIGSGKVLESTSDSKVFINLDDHGNSGLFAFPNDILYADELISAL